MTSEESASQLVLVGVDGSDASVAALRWAARYAAATGATLRATLAWHYPGAVGGPPMEKAPESIHEQTEQQQQAALDEAVARAYDGQVPAHVESRANYGHPAEVLIEGSRDADLLVVGSHGHGRRHFRAMVVGSVSIHCVTGAFCPVVVVRGGDDEH